MTLCVYLHMTKVGRSDDKDGLWMWEGTVNDAMCLHMTKVGRVDNRDRVWMGEGVGRYSE